MSFPRGTDPNDADGEAPAAASGDVPQAAAEGKSTNPPNAEPNSPGTRSVTTRSAVPQASSGRRIESLSDGADANAGGPRIIVRDEVPQAIAQR